MFLHSFQMSGLLLRIEELRAQLAELHDECALLTRNGTNKPGDTVRLNQMQASARETLASIKELERLVGTSI